MFRLHGIPQVVHADRGTSMTSKTVAQFLADLEITRSYSRPRVSNDNPYSEAWFKTLKYAPTFPDRFGSLTDAQQFMDAFIDGYNHHHRHTGIGLHTPADVHYNLAAARRAERDATLTQARARHPERFTTSRSPKIINLPDTAWINQPAQETAAEIPNPPLAPITLTNSGGRAATHARGAGLRGLPTLRRHERTPVGWGRSRSDLLTAATPLKSSNLDVAFLPL